MISFKEFCDLNEGAGSLAGLPKEFIKQITTGMNRGGENSRIELYKKNAKQKDLTAAIKSAVDTKEYAGVLVKVNDVWSFYAEYEEYSSKFKLLSPEGYASKRDSKTYKDKYSGRKEIRWFDNKELSASDLSDFINFGDDIVDVYLVTADAERLDKIAVRKDAKQIDNMSPEKKAALQKFLNKQAGEAFSYAKTILADKVKALTDSLQQNINPETMTFNIKEAEAAMSKFSNNTGRLLSDYKLIMHRMNDIIKYGNIKNNNSTTLDYQGFKQAANNLDNYLKNNMIY